VLGPNQIGRPIYSPSPRQPTWIVRRRLCPTRQPLARASSFASHWHAGLLVGTFSARIARRLTTISAGATTWARYSRCVPRPRYMDTTPHPSYPTPSAFSIIARHHHCVAAHHAGEIRRHRRACSPSSLGLLSGVWWVGLRSALWLGE
jgi:hypothetical protein